MEMMETKEWKTLKQFADKPKWGPGDWLTEPDKLQWFDEKSGLPCLIVRGPSGALCGYVGVGEKHPYFKKDYNDVPVEVHGGLTFADHCCLEREEGICHIWHGDGERWWLGFDCAHAWDLSPKSEYKLEQMGFYKDRKRRVTNDVYRNLAYVKAEVESLAAQLAAVIA